LPGSKKASSEYYRGKNILITGGCGTIGSAIVEKVLSFDVNVVRVYDNNEYSLFKLQQKYGDDARLRFLIGDVRDKTRLLYALKGIDIVFHAAALKHVSLCEYNPFEAIKTNVEGTQNTIEASLEENVEKFVMISTDKAVSPINTMGATKLLGEKLTIAANYYKGDKRTMFSCVRFGNVLNSRGSVFEIFRSQIAAGGPITLTSPDMKRFVMLIPEAVQLILESARVSKGGEVFILKMPALKISELADIMIKKFAPRYGHDPDKIRVEMIGERRGEKLDEELMTLYESNYALDLEDYYAIIPLFEMDDNYRNVEFKGGAKLDALNTGNVALLSKAEIEALIKGVMADDDE
jgi:UDP-N-acetylglucosamine 4,6-dehydratase